MHTIVIQYFYVILVMTDQNFLVRMSIAILQYQKHS